jgi:hypothetical protein
MSVKMTINKSFRDKLTKLREDVADDVGKTLGAVAEYAVAISPVDTAAYVESWSIRPIGSGGGRSRSALTNRISYKGDPSGQASKRALANEQLTSDLKAYSEQITEAGGAILINRSPHANKVEALYKTATRIKNRFR